jgi:hypothetical protein
MIKLFGIILFLSIISGFLCQENGTNENPCAGVANNRFVSNKRGCAYYYTCVNETAHENFCPDGFWFNEPKQLCDLPSNVQCILDLPEVNITCPDVGIFQIPHPYLCNRFFLCVNGNYEERICPDGEHFSNFDSSCVGKEFAYCFTDHIFCPPITRANQIEFVPNRRTCRSYYICSQAFVLLRECAPGTRYDEDKRWCEIDDATISCELKHPPGFPSITETDQCTANDPTITFLPHPESCTAYFLCFNGESHLKFCPTGLQFDRVNNRCDLAENVNCVIQTPDAQARLLAKLLRLFNH